MSKAAAKPEEEKQAVQPELIEEAALEDSQEQAFVPASNTNVEKLFQNYVQEVIYVKKD